MHYLPLPRTVVPAVAIATVVLVVWLGWGSIRDPEGFWAPGDLSRYHAAVTHCMSCHEPFRGPVSANASSATQRHTLRQAQHLQRQPFTGMSSDNSRSVWVVIPSIAAPCEHHFGQDSP
jgi:hypothetical protein